MHIRQAVAVFIFLLLKIYSIPAQTGSDLHRYDLNIARFLERNQRDSFLFYAQEKLWLARASDSLAVWGWTQLDLHDFYSENGDDEQALTALETASQQRWREPNNPEEWEPFLYVQQNKGWCLFQSGKVWQAVQAYESAAQLYERFRYPDLDAVETIYKPLGAHYTRLGDNEKAIAVFEKALLLGGDSESMAGLYSNIGIVQWNRGEFIPAAAAFRKGLDLKHVSAIKKALLLSGLAQTMLDAGEVRQAFEIAKQSLALIQTQRHKDPQTIEYRAYARRAAGQAATALGRYADAGQFLAGALTDAAAVFGNTSRDVGKIEIARSHLFRKQGNLQSAIESANRALSAILPGFKPKKPRDIPDLDSFYEENVIFEALEAKALAAEQMFRQYGDVDWLSLALLCHDLAWQAEIKLRKVHQYSSSKLNLQQNIRVREESAMRIVRLLYEKTGQAKYIEKAFAITERSKAILLLDAVRDNLLRQGAAGKDARFAQITALRQSLAYFERNLLLEPANSKVPQWRIEADALNSQIILLERDLAASYPHLSNRPIVSSEMLPSTGDLADNEALVAYFARENTLDVFIFQKNEPPIWHCLSNDDTLKTLTIRFLSFFENSAAILNAPQAYLGSAHALWQKIVPSEVTGIARLCIIPDGFLNFIPFEALVVEPPGGYTSLRNAAYLIVKQEVRYAWSLAVLHQQNNLQQRAERYLLAVAPGFAHGERGLAPLKSGRNEWEPAAGGIRELVEQEAVAQHFLQEAPHYRIVHLSSHAFSDLNPRVELYDRALFLPDIYALPLDADLVVLSACQTGQGREQKGEGVMSLARAFAQSGAACIVSSLWSVNDHSTAWILARFYQHLHEGNTICKALRQAKIDYLTDPNIGPAVQSPYFWAGLAPVGADRKIRAGGHDWSILAPVLGAAVAMALLVLFRYFIRRKAMG
ncbi:MAG: CHAT domain-containing protein [Haliscomenobacteraceae bacterium CHB4]|nr:CHAT domain-containing protein [Haliscomenobacteraceae bacterium CHB4]